MNTPNKITIGRIILVPIFMLLLYTDLPYWALAVLFFASDSILFFVRFKKDCVFKTHFMVMLTYILAQFLIVEGFILMV